METTAATAEACAIPGATELWRLVIFCEQDTRIEREIVHNHGVIDLRQPALRLPSQRTGLERAATVAWRCPVLPLATMSPKQHP